MSTLFPFRDVRPVQVWAGIDQAMRLLRVAVSIPIPFTVMEVGQFRRDRRQRVKNIWDDVRSRQTASDKAIPDSTQAEYCLD